MGSGVCREEGVRDHDATNLIAPFERCKNKWIKLNREKMKLHREVITLLSHDLTKDGLKPSATKIEAIENFAQLEDKANKVQRLLGKTKSDVYWERRIIWRVTPRTSAKRAVPRALLKSDSSQMGPTSHRGV